jgi:hypothetical protein
MAADPSRRQIQGTRWNGRCTRTPDEPAEADDLARLIARAAQAGTAWIADCYTVTAFVLEQTCCADTRTITVELLEDKLAVAERRWIAVAHDELAQLSSALSRGATATAAIEGIDWCNVNRSYEHT